MLIIIPIDVHMHNHSDPVSRHLHCTSTTVLQLCLRQPRVGRSYSHISWSLELEFTIHQGLGLDRFWD